MICQCEPMELSEPVFESVADMSYVFGDIGAQQIADDWRGKFETIIAQKESDINERLIQDTGKSMNWPSNLNMPFLIHASYCPDPDTYLTKCTSLAEILDEQRSGKRQTPKAVSFVEPIYKDDPKLFVAKPGELVKLNCPDTDLTPITMDVVIINLKKLTNPTGWLLSKIAILGERHRYIDLNVQFKEDGTIYSWDKKQTIGEWSIRIENGFALWQQPSNWSMICQRAVSHRLHIELFEDKRFEDKREFDMVMLFDKTNNLHYLQQDSSFYQMNEDCVMMKDTNRNPAWSAQPINTR